MNTWQAVNTSSAHFRDNLTVLSTDEPDRERSWLHEPFTNVRSEAIRDLPREWVSMTVVEGKSLSK